MRDYKHLAANKEPSIPVLQMILEALAFVLSFSGLMVIIYILSVLF